jgi:phenylacetate-CoA ligase
MNRNLSFIRYIKYSNILNRITYLKWYKFIEKSQWWSKEELKKYQWQKLKFLLEHAYKYVPYYLDLFKRIGATPNDINNWDDFDKIPFLTKDIIRERTNDFISSHIKNRSKLTYYTTGGSTGEPLGFYQNFEISAIEDAFMFNQWHRVGFKEQSRRVILRGEPVSNNQLFKKYRFSNDWLLSSYHLSEENIRQYVDFLNRIRPEFLHVYPSSIYIFTQLLIQSKLDLNFSPKAILCGSEPVHDYQRELIEKTLNSRVYSWIGQAEGSVLAGECEYSTDYHAWPQHSYIELINNEGNIINDKTNTGEIVGTTINNLTFPFIRYKTGDLAFVKGDHCEKCGRQFTLLGNIQGRIQDTVVLDDGTPFPIGPAIFGIHDKNWSLVNRIQILQEKRGEIIIRVDTCHDKTEVQNFLQETMEKRIGHFLKYKIIFTKEIEKTNQGKHRLLIRRILD